VNSVPFVIAGFLLINPLLERGFRRFDLQSEKLHFWVMVSTGTAWILALVYFLLTPAAQIIENPAAIEGLLPSLEFSYDWISAALVLSATGLTFVNVMDQHGDPQSNAWFAGLGGACVIGLEMNSAYSFGLLWTIVEGFHFYISYRDQKIALLPRKYLPVVFMRLSAPSAIILYSLTMNDPPISLFSSTTQPGAGLVLIAAGLIGIISWYLTSLGTTDGQGVSLMGAYENWLPALLGLLLVIRGGMRMEAGNAPLLIPLILSSLLIITALVGLVWDQTSRLWILSCGLLVSTVAIISGADLALGWGLVMFLPGLLFWKRSNQSEVPLVALIFGLIGLLPIPFLPAWVGVSTFSAGGVGIILGLSYGILMGSVLINFLRRWRSSRDVNSRYPLLGIIGAAAVSISQIVISLRLDLIPASQSIFNKPVTIWISYLGFIPVLLLGNYLPLRDSSKLIAVTSIVSEGIEKILTSMVHFLDRFVKIISDIFEEQGGLIWALLIGLLLISLISASGG
jgi:hypothetical protein